MNIARTFIERLLNDLIKASEQGFPRHYLCEDLEFSARWNESKEFRAYFYHWGERFKNQYQGAGFLVGSDSDNFLPCQTPLFTSAKDNYRRPQLRIDFLRWLLKHGELT